jgi:hypothetical protein
MHPGTGSNVLDGNSVLGRDRLRVLTGLDHVGDVVTCRTSEAIGHTRWSRSELGVTAPVLDYQADLLMATSGEPGAP